MLYKALMNYKRMEQQRVSSLVSDTRTITEAMLRKQAEAQVTKLAVSASSQYATNEKYVEVNSGRHPRIKVFKGMHALSPDEVDVYSSLVEGCPSAQVLKLLFTEELQQKFFRVKKYMFSACCRSPSCTTTACPSRAWSKASASA